MVDNRRKKTACDRCYELREKCDRPSNDAVCARCDRLALECSTVRPIRKAGRKPRRHGSKADGQAASVPHALPELSRLSFGPWLENEVNLDPSEKELLMFLLDQPKNLGYHVVTASFQIAEQRSLMALLPAALPVLKDAYLALASALKKLQPGVDNTDEADALDCVRYASSAMETLRTLPVTSKQELAVCLTLGAALAFAVYSTLGVGATDVCEYCLRATRLPLMVTPETWSLDVDTESRQTFLIAVELMDCVVQCRKLTLRIPAGAALSTVDRHFGLCLPLLCHYYDLCAISYALVNSPDTAYMAHFEEQLDTIHALVDAWRPSCQDVTPDRFESSDLVHLLAQAKVYRLAALLFTHRLRYLFGEQDSEADIWSKEIMAELDMSEWATRRVARCVTLPFMIAAIEVRQPELRAKALLDVGKYVDQFTPTIQRASRQFLSRIWVERDRKITTRWFTSVSKPCPVLRSVDARIFP